MTTAVDTWREAKASAAEAEAELLEEAVISIGQALAVLGEDYEEATIVLRSGAGHLKTIRNDLTSEAEKWRAEVAT